MRAVIIIGLAIVVVIASLISVDAGLFGSYILFAVALGAAVILPFINTLQSPGEIKKALFALAGIIVLFVISYAIAGSDVTTEQAAKGLSENTSKLVGAGLIMFYLVAAIAIGGLIYSEINKAFK
jgi:hypothetical protein